MVGLEIDADHRAQFEVDEQQQDVVDLRMPLGDHADEGGHRRPEYRRADGEQGQVVEGLHQQVTQRLPASMHLLPQAFGPIQFHSSVLLVLHDSWHEASKLHAIDFRQ
ncbi:hypothetical protein D9M71_506120 [compost metagenome]